MSTRSDGMPSFVTFSLSRQEQAPRSPSPRQPTPSLGVPRDPEVVPGLIKLPVLG